MRWSGVAATLPDLHLANVDVTAAIDHVGRFWREDMGVKVDGPTMDLSGVGCVAEGAKVETLYGTDEVSAPDMLNAYAPVASWRRYEVLIVRLGGSGRGRPQRFATLCSSSSA